MRKNITLCVFTVGVQTEKESFYCAFDFRCSLRYPVETIKDVKTVVGCHFNGLLQAVHIRFCITAHQFTITGMTVETQNEIFLCTFIQQLAVEAMTITVHGLFLGSSTEFDTKEVKLQKNQRRN